MTEDEVEAALAPAGKVWKEYWPGPLYLVVAQHSMGSWSPHWEFPLLDWDREEGGASAVFGKDSRLKAISAWRRPRAPQAALLPRLRAWLGW
jgi:hypothetical protein